MKKVLLLAGLVVIFGLVSFSKEGYGMPALEKLQSYTQPDGTKIKAIQHGDEFFHYVSGEDGSVYEKREDNYWYYKTSDNNPKTRTSVAKVGIDPKPKDVVRESDLVQKEIGKKERNRFNQEQVKRSGTKWNKDQNVLVVLVEFNDVSLITSEEEWYQKIFSTEGNTVKNFFLEQTNQRINVTPAKDTDFVKNGILKVALDQEHPGTGYGVESFDSFDIARKVIHQLKEKVDFSEYDTNGNKRIELNELHIMFVLAGYEQSLGSYGKSVWGHKGYHSHLTEANSLKFTDFTMFGEKMNDWGTDKQTTIGVMCHEFGHDLELPDLYNIEKKSGAGLGITSLMSIGATGAISTSVPEGSTPVGLDAYSKISLGVPYEEVDPSQFYEKKVKAIADFSDPTIIKIQSQNPNEYFLIENRQLSGFDLGMKAFTRKIKGGIGIYRVNSNYTSGNINNEHQLVTVLEADENVIGYSKYKRNEYTGSDPFYYLGEATSGFNEWQSTQVSTSTVPSTQLADGRYLDTEIEILTGPADVMDVRIGKNISVTDIKIDSQNVLLSQGEIRQLEAKISPENATNKKVKWSSSDETVVTVTEKGIVKGIKSGKATITVTSEDGGKTAICNITVDQKTSYGTAPWTWDESSQTLTFGEGNFPSTSEKEGIYETIQQKALNKQAIKHIKFTGKVKLNKQSSYLFANLYRLKSIENIHLLDTSEVVNMSRMFFSSDELTSLDLSNWDTSRVVDMSNMFHGLSYLTSLNVSNWNTSNVNDMSNMFSHAYRLKSLELSDWDTSKVQNMFFMFGSTTSISSLDLSNFDTSSVTNMSGMFYCSSVKALDISNFNTSNIKDMQGMFQSANKIEQIKLGERTILKSNCSLLNGEWTSEDKAVVYRDTQELIVQYDGSHSGIYNKTK